LKLHQGKDAFMNLPHLSLLFAGLCALIQTALTALVIIRRAQTGIHLLDGGDERLIKPIRAHANFVETVPLALLMLVLLEVNSLAAHWLWAFGLTLLVGRLLHAFGLLARDAAWARLVGMVMTLAVISLEGMLCLLMFVR
jgi:uncharacterized protein